MSTHTRAAHMEYAYAHARGQPTHAHAHTHTPGGQPTHARTRTHTHTPGGQRCGLRRKMVAELTILLMAATVRTEMSSGGKMELSVWTP